MDAADRVILDYLEDCESFLEDNAVGDTEPKFWAAAMWVITELRKRLLSNCEDKTCLEILDEFEDDVQYWRNVGSVDSKDSPFEEAYSYLLDFRELINTVDS